MVGESGGEGKGAAPQRLLDSSCEDQKSPDLLNLSDPARLKPASAAPCRQGAKPQNIFPRLPGWTYGRG